MDEVVACVQAEVSEGIFDVRDDSGDGIDGEEVFYMGMIAPSSQLIKRLVVFVVLDIVSTLLLENTLLIKFMSG